MYEHLSFLFLSVVSLGFGFAQLFFAERVFYYGERMRYAYPLEPSPFKLRSMRLNGCVLILVGLGLAWLGISG